MIEYWELTHARAVPTQSVWAMQPAFELNNLTMVRHAELTDSLPRLAQLISNAENELTKAKSARRGLVERLRNVCFRVPTLIEALLDDDDPLKDQLGAIYAIGPATSENTALSRARLLLPLWLDVNEARAAATPAKPPLTIDVRGEEMGADGLAALIEATQSSQQKVAEKQRSVTNARSALRGADNLLDRGNKRWYQAWMQAFPKETPEGAAAQSQIPTERGVAQATVLVILSATLQPDRTVLVTLDSKGGKHATTKELQFQLPGEEEFGHSTPIVADQLTVGPFEPGSEVSFRTAVSNSNPGVVISPVVTVPLP